jgi:hypothetical protein
MTAMALPDWASIAAIISAMIDVVQIGRQTFSAYLKKRQDDPRLPERARALEAALSTYSQEEVAAIVDRITACRDRFVAEGSGKQRRTCLCSVLRDIKEGNGGTIPDREWEQVYQQLKCAA